MTRSEFEREAIGYADANVQMNRATDEYTKARRDFETARDRYNRALVSVMNARDTEGTKFHCHGCGVLQEAVGPLHCPKGGFHAWVTT